MIVKVMYCKYLRKDGTFNSVCFDTNRKIFNNDDSRYSPGCAFVSATHSYDVDSLRKELIADGYVESEEVCKYD